MTRLDLARALVRPIGGYAIILCIIAVVATIVVATLTDREAGAAAAGLTALLTAFGAYCDIRRRERRDTPTDPE